MTLTMTCFNDYLLVMQAYAQTITREVAIALPWPPSINHYWLANGKRRYISQAGVQFRRDVIGLCSHIDPFPDKVRVNIMAFPPDRRRRDADNICKPMFDALQHAGVYKDDCLVNHFSIEKSNVIKEGRIELVITC